MVSAWTGLTEAACPAPGPTACSATMTSTGHVTCVPAASGSTVLFSASPAFPATAFSAREGPPSVQDARLAIP